MNLPAGLVGSCQSSQRDGLGGGLLRLLQGPTPAAKGIPGSGSQGTSACSSRPEACRHRKSHSL